MVVPKTTLGIAAPFAKLSGIVPPEVAPAITNLSLAPFTIWDVGNFKINSVKLVGEVALVWPPPPEKGKVEPAFPRPSLQN